MLLLSVALVVLKISVASGFRICGDCMKIEECSQALEFIDSYDTETVQNVLNSNLCGFDGENKVCCSGFDGLKTVESFENHPNLHLLPDECGKIETPSYYPWAVDVFKKDNQTMKFQCVGTLINSRYVLTTAACVEDENTTLAVRVCNDVDCETNYKSIAVTDKLMHGNYSLEDTRPINDIGLLRLKNPVNFSCENASAVCLPISVELRQVNIYDTKATVTGWISSDSEYNATKYNKHQNTVTIYTTEACDTGSQSLQGHNEVELKKQLCTEDIAPDSCWGYGDAILMVEGSYNGINRFIQYGISSYISSECQTNSPTFYTDFRTHVKWILDTIEE